MIRGTTPQHSFAVNLDLTKATVYVTYNQKSVTVEKTGEDLEITPYNIKVKLTQEDTLSFVAGKPVRVQIRYITEDGYADASDIYELEVEDILKNGEIYYGGKAPEDPTEPEEPDDPGDEQPVEPGEEDTGGTTDPAET